MTTDVYLADQVGKAFCNPTEDEKRCVQFVAGSVARGKNPENRGGGGCFFQRTVYGSARRERGCIV